MVDTIAFLRHHFPYCGILRFAQFVQLHSYKVEEAENN